MSQPEPPSINVKIASTEQDFINYCHEIISANPPLIGFDTETALSHQNTKVSLIQIYDGQTCYLFRLSEVSSLPSVFHKLMGRLFIKVGFDIEADAYKLRTYNDITVQGLVDIQNVLRSLNYPFTSMKDTVSHFFEGYLMEKKINHQAWDDPILSEVALQYAVYDAYLSYECYVRIMKMDRPQFITTNEHDFLEDRIDLLQVLRKTQTVKSLKLKSAQNFLVNSYSPWRNRYPEGTRRSQVEACLEKLHEDKIILIDYDTVHLYPEELPGSTLTIPAFPGLVTPKLTSGLNLGLATPELTLDLPLHSTSIHSKELGEILQHLRKQITVSNIKAKSLVNILSNSYGPWKGLNPNDKFNQATQVVNQLVATGYIKINRDGSYNIFD